MIRIKKPVIWPRKQKFFIREGDDKHRIYKHVYGYRVELLDWIDTFVHKVDTTWRVTEISTGFCIAYEWRTRREAIIRAQEALRVDKKKTLRIISETIRDYGQAPKAQFSWEVDNDTNRR